MLTLLSEEVDLDSGVAYSGQSHSNSMEKSVN